MLQQSALEVELEVQVNNSLSIFRKFSQQFLFYKIFEKTMAVLPYLFVISLE